MGNRLLPRRERGAEAGTAGGTCVALGAAAPQRLPPQAEKLLGVPADVLTEGSQHVRRQPQETSRRVRTDGAARCVERARRAGRCERRQGGRHEDTCPGSKEAPSTGRLGSEAGPAAESTVWTGQPGPTHTAPFLGSLDGEAAQPNSGLRTAEVGPLERKAEEAFTPPSAHRLAHKTRSV